MKKLLSLLLALMLILSAVTVVAAEEIPTSGETQKAETQNVEETAEQPAPYAKTQTLDPPAISTSIDAGYPEITAFVPAKDGVTIQYTAYDGAANYRVFYKTEGESYKRAGTTAETKLTVTGLAADTTYFFTVRAMDDSGAYCSKYNTDGWEFTYRTPPVLSSATSVIDGIQVKWKASSGAGKYRVYVKEDGAWQWIANTSKLTYTDTNVVSGKKYRYTVRAATTDGVNLTHFDTAGVTCTYVAAPKITKAENLDGSVKFTFKASAGAQKYRMFIKDGSWKKLGNTTATNFTYKGMKNGQTATFTVRAIDAEGNYISGYYTEGFTHTYYAPPAFTVTGGSSGATLSWSAQAGINSHRVYRKPYGGSWGRIADVAGTSYTDTAYPKNTPVCYTLRCLNDDGTTASSYNTDEVYYYNGKIANGKITVGSNTYNFTNGKQKQGFVTVGGKTYYYNAKGEIMKNGLVGSKSEGYGVADKNGVVDLKFTGVAKNSKGYWYLKNGKLDFTLRNGITYNGEDWNVQDGKATKVTTAAERTLFRALKLVYKNTNSSMTKAQKLRTMFNFARTHFGECSPRKPHYRGLDWPVVYANDMFVNGKGNCFSYGASFAYLAKAIGYQNCYACNSGGHGWAEVDGLVYDPEWSLHSDKSTYFGISYDTRTDVAYKSAIAPGEPYMHVRV